MKLLLTGATGFIGKHLLPLLNQHEVLCVGRSEPEFLSKNQKFLKVDLLNLGSAETESQWQNAVREFKPESCIHLAWHGLPDYSLDMCLKNFDSSARLMRLMVDIGCSKVFYAGTCFEYGSLQGCVTEDRIGPELGDFASTKDSLRVLCENLASAKNINFIWGRMFYVYGSGQRPTSLIPMTLNALSEGKAPPVKNMLAANDFIHAKDVGSAILALIEAPYPISGIFNIGYGEATKVGDIVEIAKKLLDKTGVVSPDASGPPTSSFWANLSKIKQATGWEPKISLEAGIREMIA